MGKNRGTVRKRRTNTTKVQTNKGVGGANVSYNFEENSGKIVYHKMFDPCPTLKQFELPETQGRTGFPSSEIAIKDQIIENAKHTGSIHVDSYKHQHNYMNIIADNYNKFNKELWHTIYTNLPEKNGSNLTKLENWRDLTYRCATKAYWDNFSKQIKYEAWDIILPSFFNNYKPQSDVRSLIEALELKEIQPSIAAQNTAANSEISFTKNQAEAIYAKALEDYKSKSTDTKTLMTDAKKLLKGSTNMINDNELVIAGKMVQLGYNITNLLSTVGGKYKRTRRNKHKGTRRN